ncbi:hypothetical protein [Thiohalorhabdus methylotrophus]|uniref:Restriction endonuclease n=1 Tax=Thiohalorhabdus methylotrophus TaxID=3242694 RepID=A0ABV4TTJ9_9GAMM
MRRLIPGQERHDGMVRRIAHGLRDGGFNEVRADGVDGFELPDTIDGRVPDVTARGHRFHIYEVETEETLSSEETRLQWQAFSRFARHDDQAHFVIIVPQGVGLKAEAQKNYYQLSAEVREEDFAAE